MKMWRKMCRIVRKMWRKMCRIVRKMYETLRSRELWEAELLQNKRQPQAHGSRPPETETGPRKGKPAPGNPQVATGPQKRKQRKQVPGDGNGHPAGSRSLSLRPRGGSG